MFIPRDLLSSPTVNTQLIVLFVSGKLVFQKGRAIDTGEVEIGAQVMQTIPPGLFWRFQITIHHPMYLKFNISLAKDSLLGIYGRRNIPPTHTQVISNNTNSIMLTFSNSSGCERSQCTFKAGREEGTGCNHKKQSVYPFLLLRSSYTLKPRSLRGRDSVMPERSAVVTTVMWLSGRLDRYTLCCCASPASSLRRQ